MPQTRLLATGIIGFIISMLGCVTPVLVALLAALGVSGSMGWLDYFLLPQRQSLPRSQSMRCCVGDAATGCHPSTGDLPLLLHLVFLRRSAGRVKAS